ncbi:major facilitator superfamily protein [Hirsutella rhossiliensis]
MKPSSVLGKIDLYLLPLLLLASFLAHLDKNSLAYAAVLGMGNDLHLHGQQYSWLGSIFYIGYLLMELPTSWLLTHLPIGKYLGSSLILWGGCLCTMAACTSFAAAATVRFCLGVLEAGLLPSCIVITACWYRREEQPLRAALWFGPFSGIFGGILAYAIGGMRTGIPVWKALFLIYGGSTIFVGIVCLVAIPDSHGTAWFLSKTEREEAKLRTQENQTGEDMRKGWKLSHVVEATKDAKYWTVFVFGVCQSITNAGITNFNPLILSGFGYSKTTTVLLAAPQGFVALVAQVAASIVALYIPNIRCLLWVLSCFPALAGVVIVQLVDVTKNRIAALMGLYLTGFYNVSWVLAMSLISSNTAGATKKSFVSVSMAISYAVGNMVGPQFFLESQKPQYHLGIGVMIFSFVMMAVCGMVYWTICIRQNEARDRTRRESSPLIDPTSLAGLHLAADESQDKTDFEIATFRYTY